MPCPSQAPELHDLLTGGEAELEGWSERKGNVSDPLLGCARLLINLRSTADTADGALSK